MGNSGLDEIENNKDAALAIYVTVAILKSQKQSHYRASQFIRAIAFYGKQTLAVKMSLFWRVVFLHTSARVWCSP